MTTKLTVTAGVVVRADQQQVWDLVVDWARQREWILATSTEGGHGPGAVVTARTGVGPVGFTDRMEIIEWEPPRRCTMRHLGKFVRGHGVFEVLPPGPRVGRPPRAGRASRAGRAPRTGDSDSSEFRWTEQIELPLPPAIGRPVAAALVGPVTRVGLGWSLRRFARLIGQDAPRRA